MATLSLYSDDVVDAAWNNGLGVHALIWVCFFRQCLLVQSSYLRTCILSSALMEMTNGLVAVTLSFPLYTVILKPNLSLEEFNLAQNPSSTRC